MKEKVIGILGGMGPLATVELFHRIVLLTPAKKDQEHPRIIIYNNPKIPDRTEYILGKGESPLPELIRSAEKLENCGADFIIMPCNTAHLFVDEIQNSINIPLVSMIDAAVNKAKRMNLRRVGIMATTGTIVAGIYQNALRNGGMEPIIPSEKEQEEVMEGIYQGIKAGNIKLGKEKLLKIARELEKRCDGIIAGCTEISVALSQEDLEKPFIDALDAIAEKAVSLALGPEDKMEDKNLS